MNQKQYYIVLLNGVPVDVTTLWSRASKIRDELSVKGKDAIILPCVPVQTELDLGEFSSEEPTEPDNKCQL